MSNRFFIYSLPRSGSAWLSVFLTGPESFCYHEPTSDDRECKQFDGRTERTVGAVDTAAILWAPGIHRAINAKPYRLIRDPREVAASIHKLGHHFDLAKDVEPLFRADSEGDIHYSQLRDVGYLEEVWGMVIGRGFDRERAKLLVEMNIQRDFETFMERFK